MILHGEINASALYNLIRHKTVCLGGNRKLKIYGTLQCSSGKRMKLENRVFFESEDEAIRFGYTPCGNCLKEKYKKWKDGSV